MTQRQRQILTSELDELVAERVEAVMGELRAQMAELERVTNDAIASLPPAKRAPAATKAKGDPRWLLARFPSGCAHANCTDRVAKGDHVWYVPGAGVYHESCAPAEANAKVAA